MGDVVVVTLLGGVAVGLVAGGAVHVDGGVGKAGMRHGEARVAGVVAVLERRFGAGV